MEGAVAGAAQRRAELTRQISALRRDDAAAKRIIGKVEKTAACRDEYRRQQERDMPAANLAIARKSAKIKTPAPGKPARVIWWDVYPIRAHILVHFCE